MKPTNYCRSMVLDLRKRIRDGSLSREAVRLVEPLFEASRSAVKFMLPEDGLLIVDTELRGLRGAGLRLPFPVVALEFRSEHDPRSVAHDLVPLTKNIVFASEDDGKIRIFHAGFDVRRQDWLVVPQIRIDPDGWMRDGKLIYEATDPRIPIDDYQKGLVVLFSFLNSLACSNVGIEKVPRINRPGKVKSALPFDDYHILTVDIPSREAGGDGGHGSREGRTPREHLRRGHIRRLADGRRIWINATIVAAGKGGGALQKDYLLRPRGGA